jgi:hypothetical protein
MGLLDDAIREHLDLKRRRGADPGEVAREQREALDPVPRDAHVELLEDEQPPFELAEHAPGAPEAGSSDGSALVESDTEPAEQPSEPVLSGAAAGETEELDMRSVLGSDAEPEDGDSLDWETPGAPPDQAVLADEEDEDVLEETPEFLRDTPEEDRLWFEQRPPRDFDFDK